MQFDLKNCTLRLKDGYSGPGGTFQINNGPGYMTGDTTITIDTGTGAIATGDTFTIFGESNGTIHTVTAHTETSGNTTSLTFTPGLSSSVADNAALTVLPHFIDINVAEGTISFVEKKDRVYVKNRGILGTVRNGDQQPMEVKFDILWAFLRGSSTDTADSSNPGAPVTPEDFLKQRGFAANYVSTDPDPCAPYCVDFEIKHNPPCANVQRETILAKTYRYEELSHDAKTGIISSSGKCNVQELQSTRSDF